MSKNYLGDCFEPTITFGSIARTFPKYYKYYKLQITNYKYYKLHLNKLFCVETHMKEFNWIFWSANLIRAPFCKLTGSKNWPSTSTTNCEHVLQKFSLKNNMKYKYNKYFHYKLWAWVALPSQNNINWNQYKYKYKNKYEI